MEKVNGIGGVFFRAHDPKALAAWYESHLGVRKTPESYEEGSWWQEKGPTVFAPFKSDTDYFGDDMKQWMINFRVDDLDAMAAQLTEAGIDVDVVTEDIPQWAFRPSHRPGGQSHRVVGTGGNRPERARNTWRRGCLTWRGDPEHHRGAEGLPRQPGLLRG